MNTIQNELRNRFGLSGSATGNGALLRFVRQRMKTLGLKELEDYKSVLASSATEIEVLMEHLVVPETWFFRNEEAFAQLVRTIREDWLPRNSGEELRILSLPCSTGEEPYSMVIALLDAGVPGDRFHVEAVDLSERALATARRGVYRKNSFRGNYLGFRARHFQNTPEGFHIDPEVRSHVRFSRGNIFSPVPVKSERRFDIVFCRNLLIYFDREMQGKALEHLENLMSPDGLLFVGPAEIAVVLDHGFEAADLPMAFACRKSRAEQKKHPVASFPSPLPHTAAGDSLRTITRSIDGRHPNPGPPPKSGGKLAPELVKAENLATQGRLKEAETVCLAYLQGQRDSAQAYYMLGRVRDLQDDSGAAQLYRKALYLDPQHCQALLRLSALAEKDGNLQQARLYEERARRSQPREE